MFSSGFFGLVKFSTQDLSYIVEFDSYIIRSAFQAIIASDGEVFGYEALSRIQCRDTGQAIRPDIFFNAVDKLENFRGILFEINRCHLMTFRLSKFYSPHMKLFLNLPPDFFDRLIKDKYTIYLFKGLLSAYGFSPDDVIAEVTEAHALDDKKLAQGVEFMSDGEFNIAIDDFGDEGSTLERVESCRPHIVKISRHLYLGNMENNQSYLVGLIDYFHNIGVKVVIEGIEEPSHIGILKEMGVDFFQGFLFHKPELVELLDVEDAC